MEWKVPPRVGESVESVRNGGKREDGRAVGAQRAKSGRAEDQEGMSPPGRQARLAPTPEDPRGGQARCPRPVGGSQYCGPETWA